MSPNPSPEGEAGQNPNVHAVRDGALVVKLLEDIIWGIGDVRDAQTSDDGWRIRHPDSYYGGKIDAYVEIGKQIISRATP